MKNYSFRQFRADVTGPHAIELKAYLYASPLFITFSIIITTDLTDIRQIAIALGANLISLACCAVVTALFYFTAFRNRKIKPVRLGWVAAFGLVVGFTKGATTAYFFTLFGIVPDFVHSLLERVFQTTINGFLFVPICAVIYSTLQRFRLQREVLVSELVRTEVAKQPGFSRSEDLKLDNNHEAAKVISKVAGKLTSLIDQKPDSSASLADTIRRLLDEDVRPLSHRIWNAESRRLTNFSLGDLSRLAMLNYPFQTLPVIVFFHLTIVPYLIDRSGWVHGLMDGMVSLLSVAVLFWLGGKVRFKSLPLATAWFLFIIALAEISTSLLHPLFGHELNVDFYIRADLVNLLWLIEISFLAALFKTAISTHAEIENQLIKLVGDREAVHEITLQKQRIQNRELAQYLHGQVQNQMLLSALRLESEGTANEPQMAKVEVENLVSMLQEATTGAFRKSTSKNLKAELKAIQQQWQGMLDIALQIDERIANEQYEPDFIYNIGQMVNEAVNNANRHGLASKVEVVIRPAIDNAIEVTLKDDGLGPKVGVPGLGSSLYTSLAGNSWSLVEGENGGATLTLRMPV